MFETTDELSAYLAPNERVLWQGQGRRRLNSAAAGGYAFIAMFVALALIFIVLLLTTTRGGRSSGGDAVALVILPFIFIGVGLGVGIPLVLLGQRSANARYVVTNLSALIVSAPTAWAGRRVTVVPLKNLSQLTLTENRDGTGTLTFGQTLFSGYGRYSNGWLTDSMAAFWNIEQPQTVYQLIRRQMAGD